ncbi:hypothetical protein SAMN05421847_1466 [Halpernia humi]|uniref:Uncharacterized protein n=1 Tax=Halpernia humi TaxID=493375 RepID=A0A1H5X7G8_9FLAO|nr:hypothetical protein [Halpernia humi]SEG07662.1 hypothetical protein SAMN05421847_1466 [Halpernia humi]
MKREEYRFKLLEKALNTKHENSYWNTVFQLRNFVDTEMIEKCFQLIESNEPKSQILGIDILSQLGTERKKIIKKLLKIIFDIILRTDNEKLICSCLIAISHNNKNLTEKHLIILTSFKKSKSKEIRYALVFSLLSIENKIAIETLILLTKDRSPKVRDWATFGIGTQLEIDNPRIREILYVRCFDKDDQTKQEAIKGLSNRNDERVFEIILEEIKTENFGSLLFDTILNIKNGNLFLPQLRLILSKTLQEENINKEWIEALENCIEVLERDDYEVN